MMVQFGEVGVTVIPDLLIGVSDSGGDPERGQPRAGPTLAHGGLGNYRSPLGLAHLPLVPLGRPGIRRASINTSGGPGTHGRTLMTRGYRLERADRVDTGIPHDRWTRRFTRSGYGAASQVRQHLLLDVSA